MQFLEKLWKMWENIEITTERRGNYLVLEPSYHTAKFFTEHLWQQKWENSNINE